jgi:hypothetical protein
VSNSVPVKNSELRDDEWPTLPMILSSTPRTKPTAVNKVILAKNSPEKEEFQISKVHGPSGSNHDQGSIAEQRMIVNGNNKV